MPESGLLTGGRWSHGHHLFPAATAPDWLHGYAALPFAQALGAGRQRVFFSGRDAAGRSAIGACTLALDPLAVEPGSATPEPLLRPGGMGAFDESGCSMSSLVVDGDRWLLYYTGWMLGRTVPFYLAIGMAVSEDAGQTFRRYSPAPLLDRNAADPVLCASPWVLREEGRWRMWYVSATHWELTPDGPRHHYLVKHAESADGLAWRRDGAAVLGFADPAEHAIGRPCVVRDGDRYRMWFCVRGARYRLAYAESPDGLAWQRLPLAAPPRGHWDADMQAYPAVFRHGATWAMLYNGNGYGATGFGCALSTDSPHR